MKTLNFLFGMKERVSRSQYFAWGVSLMALKYAGEVAIYYAYTKEWLLPWNFLSPLISTRYPALSPFPESFCALIILFTVPFIWVGTGMSIRRAADAGAPPWLGILFLLPGFNFLIMAVLSLVPSARIATWEEHAFFAENQKVHSLFAVAIVFALIGTFFVWCGTNLFKSYGNSLYIGSPLILGLVQGFYINRQRLLSKSKTIANVGATVILIHLLLLVFALEGLICLAMSLPIALPLSAIGALFGYAIAKYGKKNLASPIALTLIIPVMPWAEKQIQTPHQDVVLSSIVIDAKPDEVWPNVIKFSDLPPATETLFKLGVAHPVRARIDGEGVGAIRRCEFSTGAFVEPITVWDEPNHLAFSVQYQPEPMKELSFYDHVDAPHLHGYFRSIKGEFRLTPTIDGKTLLEGRTWYEIDMHPGWYWQNYGRWFIHQIHQRVLGHIKNLTEHAT